MSVICYPILLVVDIPNGTSVFTAIQEELKNFDFKYQIFSIIVRNELNDLASIMLEISGVLYPTQTFFIDTTNRYKEQNKQHIAYYSKETESLEYPFNVITKERWTLKIYGINTHTVKQKVYILLNGCKVDKPCEIQLKNIR